MWISFKSLNDCFHAVRICLKITRINQVGARWKYLNEIIALSGVESPKRVTFSPFCDAPTWQSLSLYLAIILLFFSGFALLSFFFCTSSTPVILPSFVPSVCARQWFDGTDYVTVRKDSPLQRSVRFMLRDPFVFYLTHYALTAINQFYGFVNQTRFKYSPLLSSPFFMLYVTCSCDWKRW